MELNKVYPFTHGEFKFIEQDIMVVNFHEKRVTLEAVSNLQHQRIMLIGSQPYYAILDLRGGFVKFTAEAKAWAAAKKESNVARIMDILLVNNWTMKLEATFYITFFKPQNRTKIATSMENALEVIQKEKEKSLVNA